MPLCMENGLMEWWVGAQLHLPKTLVLHMRLLLQSKPTHVTYDIKL